MSDLADRLMVDAMGFKRVEWHGWSRGSTSLHIGKLPGRKRVCLYVLDGAILTPLAYFTTEVDARTCMQAIDSLTMETP